jgi:DNA-binding CsgD family transcriptional regulator
MPIQDGQVPISIEPISKPKISNSPVIVQRNKGRNGWKRAIDNLQEIATSEKDFAVWELLARGYTRTQVSEELGMSRMTVNAAVKRMMERADLFIQENVEDWRAKQLAIYNQEISRSSRDAEQQSVPVLDEEGVQVISRNGAPKWIISPMEAAKIRDMGGRRLLQALSNEAKLLGLLIQRSEVKVDQRVLAVIRSDSGDSIMEMI